MLSRVNTNKIQNLCSVKRIIMIFFFGDYFIRRRNTLRRDAYRCAASGTFFTVRTALALVVEGRAANQAPWFFTHGFTHE